MADGYIRGVALGEGTWGHVFDATRKVDGRRVAIKRIKPMDPQLGVNFTALREIKHLQELHSPYVVNLVEVFFSAGVLHLVLEFCPFDMEKIIQNKSIVLRPTHIKCYMQMILKGIDVCHKHFVLHRDLKPANLLVDESGVVKLADFGLARAHGSPEQLTSEVVTRWYRAPELLFGAPLYAGGVDMWAVGCIFAELLFRVPLFQGLTDLDQLGKIFNVLGTPTASSWPGVALLPGYVEFEARDPMNLMPLFRSSASAAAAVSNGMSSTAPPDLDLLLRLLALNPAKRITASEALLHPYFSTSPEACLPSELQLPPFKSSLAPGNDMDGSGGGQPDLKRAKN